MATDNKQTNVNLTRKFSGWEYSWWNSLNKRMPWFDAKGTHNKALLTTSDSPTYYPSGSIIWGDTDRHPADWIWNGGMRDPGVIWYWVNEDDCDDDRKPGQKKMKEWTFKKRFNYFGKLLYHSISIDSVQSSCDRALPSSKRKKQNKLRGPSKGPSCLLAFAFEGLSITRLGMDSSLQDFNISPLPNKFNRNTSLQRTFCLNI